MKVSGLLGLGLLLLMACGPREPSNPFDRSSPGVSAQIMVRVENVDFNDATIYSVVAGARARLGTVTGKGRREFRVPWPVARDLQIEISLQTVRQNARTPRLTVSPGEVLTLTIQQPLSNVFLRR